MIFNKSKGNSNEPPCPKCPYTLGYVKFIEDPCPTCKMNDFHMYHTLIEDNNRYRDPHGNVIPPPEMIWKDEDHGNKSSFLGGILEYSTSSLTNTINHLVKKDVSFSQTLMNLIDTRGLNDVEVYKRANIDRRLFSKIRKRNYKPSKQTALALAVALELSIDETNHLLTQAGYSLSTTQISDVIIAHSIRKGRYDINKINEVLYQYNQPLLGG